MSRRLALTVGINAYAAAPLAGCASDAHDWTLALADRGYQVTTLLEADATRARITAELAARVSLARPARSEDVDPDLLLVPERGRPPPSAPG